MVFILLVKYFFLPREDADVKKHEDLLDFQAYRAKYPELVGVGSVMCDRCGRNDIVEGFLGKESKNLRLMKCAKCNKMLYSFKRD